MAVSLAVVAGLTPLVAAADPGVPVPPGAAVASAPVLVVQAQTELQRFGTADVRGTAVLEETRRGLEIRLDSTLLFRRDSAALRPSARRRVGDVARLIKAAGPGRLRITGYTDDLGSSAHGLALSRRRAAAVARELRRELPTGYRMSVHGRGEANPAVANTSEAHRRMNRRVLVTFTRA